MDVRKLLGRLNPRVAQYEVGSGGAPEWTPQDIAAALGMVGDRLGREILCHTWWPDGALRSHAQLLDDLRDLQLQEWTTRMRRLEAALLAHHIAAELADGTHGRMRADVYRAHSEVEDAKANCWPKIGPQSRYRAIRDGVLAEMLDPHLCPRCGGCGEVMVDNVRRRCARCAGVGHSRVVDAERALRVGITRQVYLRVWSAPYEWLAQVCADAERRAASQLARALGAP